MKKLLIIFLLLPLGLKAQDKYGQLSVGLANNYNTQYVIGAGYHLKGFGLTLNYGETLKYGKKPAGRKFREVNLDYTVVDRDDILTVKLGASYSFDTYYLPEHRGGDIVDLQNQDTYGGYARFELDIRNVVGLFWQFTYDNLQQHAARFGIQGKIRGKNYK